MTGQGRSGGASRGRRRGDAGEAASSAVRPREARAAAPGRAAAGAGSTRAGTGRLGAMTKRPKLATTRWARPAGEGLGIEVLQREARPLWHRRQIDPSPGPPDPPRLRPSAAVPEAPAPPPCIPRLPGIPLARAPSPAQRRGGGSRAPPVRWGRAGLARAAWPKSRRRAWPGIDPWRSRTARRSSRPSAGSDRRRSRQQSPPRRPPHSACASPPARPAA